jgi:uncharacterized protein
VKDAPVQDPCRRRSAEAWVEELGADDCWRLAASAPVGRVGFVRAGRPVVLPVNHVVDHSTIVFRTDDDSELGKLEGGERVAFEIDDVDSLQCIGWSVLIAGEIVGTDRAGRRLVPPPVPWVPSDADRWWRIRPDRITGRRLHRHRRDATGIFLPAMSPG